MNERQNKGNFLYNIKYGNLPVMEFKLPDGTSGSIEKVPRWWKNEDNNQSWHIVSHNLKWN